MGKIISRILTSQYGSNKVRNSESVCKQTNRRYTSCFEYSSYPVDFGNSLIYPFFKQKWAFINDVTQILTFFGISIFYLLDFCIFDTLSSLSFILKSVTSFMTRMKSNGWRFYNSINISTTRPNISETSKKSFSLIWILFLYLQFVVRKSFYT